MQRSRFLETLAVLVLASGWFPARAQGIKDQLPPEANVRRNAGDSVQPVFDGWMQNPDGTVTMWFGYFNRNIVEEVDVPIGANNNFTGTADQGQPTHFYPRRHQYVFKVDLPKGWDPTRKLTWTLTAHGETCTAIGWLQSEWQVDEGVRQMNAGAGLAPDYENKAPTITGGSKDQTVQFGKSVKLSASATDDGVPKPRAGRGGRGGRGGVTIKWIEYRGPGQVTFNPAASEPVYGKPVESTTEATFSAPGSYWIQAVASDGLLETVHNVKVTVNK